jgi:ABC-type sugar transport system substrate-binding protein
MQIFNGASIQGKPTVLERIKRMATLRHKAGEGSCSCCRSVIRCSRNFNTSTSSKQYTIAFVMGAESDPFFQAMKLGAQQEAAARV